MFRLLGADVINMSTVLVSLANELGSNMPQLQCQQIMTAGRKTQSL